MSVELVNKLYYIWSETIILTILFWVVSPKVSLKYIKVKVLLVPIIFLALLILPMEGVVSVLIFAMILILVRWRLYYTRLIDACLYTIIIFFLKYLISYLSAFAILLYSGVYLADRVAFYSQNMQHVLFSYLYVVVITVLYRLIINGVTRRGRYCGYAHRLILISNVLVIIVLFVSLNHLYRYIYAVSSAVRAIVGMVPLLFFAVNAFIAFIFVLVYVFNSYWMTKMHFNIYQNEVQKDELTGVFTRSGGMKRLNDVYKDTKGTEHNFVLCFIDVNNLKITNDRYGHREGDQMLVTIAKAIQNGLRDTDFVLRLGGDEFLIVFDNCRLSDAQTAWHRINGNIEHSNIVNDFSYRISVSYGFASYQEHSTLSLKELVDLADAEMYKYKHKYKSKLI